MPRVILIWGLLVLACWSWLARAQPSTLEYQVKSSYLFNFIQFVTWPSDAVSPEGKFNLCVVGAERFGSALDALTGERVERREIVLRRLDTATQASRGDCHLLFIASGAAPIEIPPRRGQLTVGETPGFLKQGGIINLVEVKGRIRFEINQRAAEEAGLSISSRLLNLAVR